MSCVIVSYSVTACVCMCVWALLLSHPSNPVSLRVFCHTLSHVSHPVSQRARAQPARAERGWERETEGQEREMEVRGWVGTGWGRRKGTFDRARRHVDSTHLLATEECLSCLGVCVDAASVSPAISTAAYTGLTLHRRTGTHQRTLNSVLQWCYVCEETNTSCNPLVQRSSQHPTQHPLRRGPPR
jgi:hypothetical protein